MVEGREVGRKGGRKGGREGYVGQRRKYSTPQSVILHSVREVQKLTPVTPITAR